MGFISADLFLSVLGVAVVQALFFVEVVALLVGVIIVASTYIVFEVLTVPLVLLLNGFKVSVKVFVHVKNVVSVS